MEWVRIMSVGKDSVLNRVKTTTWRCYLRVDLEDMVYDGGQPYFWSESGLNEPYLKNSEDNDLGRNCVDRNWDSLRIFKPIG